MSNSFMQLIAEEREKAYLETAFIAVKDLDFPYSRQLDTAHVEYLRDKLERETIRPSEHMIPAVVRMEEYSTFKYEQPVDGSTPTLICPAGMQVRCLHGRHRVAAARKLQRQNHWDGRWVIEIYDQAKLSVATWCDISDRHDSIKPPDGGEFFFKIKLYHGALDSKYCNYDLEKMWRDRWIAERRKGSLKRDVGMGPLGRLINNNSGYRERLEKLYPLVALYSGIWVGSVDRMMGLGFDQEIMRYLDKLRAFWHDVFDGDPSAMGKLSRQSVEALEGTAPGACQEQALQLKGKVAARQLFAEFSNENAIKYYQKVVELSKDTMIPSLKILFSNFTYLEIIRDCMRRLVPTKGPIRGALDEIFVPQGGFWIQMNGNKLQRINKINDNFELVYLQLILFCFREHKNMPVAKFKTRKSGVTEDTADRMVLYQFALLAHKLGCRGDKIASILTEIPPSSSHKQKISTRFERRGTEPVIAGIPWIEDWLKDRELLYLPNMINPAQCAGPHLSYFFVTRSLILSLFRKINPGDVELMEELPWPPVSIDIVTDQTQQTNESGLKAAERELETMRKQLNETIKQLERSQTTLEKEKQIRKGKEEELRTRQTELETLRKTLNETTEQLEQSRTALAKITIESLTRQPKRQGERNRDQPLQHVKANPDPTTPKGDITIMHLDNHSLETLEKSRDRDIIEKMLKDQSNYSRDLFCYDEDRNPVWTQLGVCYDEAIKWIPHIILVVDRATADTNNFPSLEAVANSRDGEIEPKEKKRRINESDSDRKKIITEKSDQTKTDTNQGEEEEDL